MSERDDIIKHVKALGWTVTHSAAERTEWRNPHGARYLEPTSVTTNILKARLRKLGLVWPPVKEEPTLAKQPPYVPPADAVLINLKPTPGEDEFHRDWEAERAGDLLVEFASILQNVEQRRKLGAAIGELVDKACHEVQSAVVTLEELINETADSVGTLRTSYGDTIPGLRRDVKELKERQVAIDYDEIKRIIASAVSVATLELRSEFDKELARREAEYLELFAAAEKRINAIQSEVETAAVKERPLDAIRRRLNGEA
jgi:hypothetical protein